MNDQPKLSAILCSYDGTFEIIRKTIAHLAAQTIVDQLELVLIVPRVNDRLAFQEHLSAFQCYQIIEVDQIKSMAWTYEQGIHRATADIVAFCEDHCYPDPQWAHYLVEAHKNEWAAVGPAILNANPHSLMSWASIFIDYGEWLYPVGSGVRSHIPGHNSSYKKHILLSYGKNLEMMLEAESVLHWDLRKKGYQVYLEPKAKAHHLNFEIFSSWLVMLFYASWQFAACRADQWNAFKRLLYAMGSPLIPMVRLIRISRQLKSPGRFTGNKALLLPILFVAVCIWGIGECIGYSVGLRNVIRKGTPYHFDRLRFVKNRATDLYESNPSSPNPYPLG